MRSIVGIVAAALLGCGGEAVGPLQRSLDERAQIRSAERRGGVGVESVNTRFPPPTDAEIDAAKAENDGCTRANFWKNFLTGVGGVLTASGGGVTIGAAYATANNDSRTKLGLGVTAGALTATGGILVLAGAIIQQHFADTSCTPR
jgi:hypothetical protein